MLCDVRRASGRAEESHVVLSVMALIGTLACSGPLSPPTSQPPAEDPATALPRAAATAEPTEERYAATHLLVSHVGAARAPAGVTRTEADAHTRAIELWRRLEGGESIEELARRYSDGPSAPRGGRLGVYRPGTMMPAFERAIAGIEIDALTRPFQSPFGWHVARRDAVREAHLRHILITWKGAVRSNQRRTKEQAQALITKAKQRLDEGVSFETVAKEMGEDATAPRGGDLGIVAPGQLIPAFEDVAFALSPGQRSDIIETPYGFHLVQRVP